MWLVGWRRRIAAGALCAVWFACVMARVVHADEVTGTWTGQLEGRLNYYYERSTRVVIPTGGVAVTAPNGVRVNASYLVDVISTASIAANPMGDAVFTELRHGVGAGVGKTFAVGDNDLDLNLHGIYSTESDYKSLLGGINGSYAWNDKNSIASLNLTYVSDSILDLSQPDWRGHLKGLTSGLGFSQILSPTLVLAFGYQYVWLDGYLGNHYRKVPYTASHTPVSEAPPSTRLRHNLEAQLAWFLPATNTTLQLFGRVYADSWDISAITPELRVYQGLGRDWNVRLRFRYYQQSRADFAPPSPRNAYLVDYTGPTTNDPKLLDFHSEQLGLRISYSLRVLEATALDFASRAVLDLSFDRQWCSSTFGNNVIATAGARWLF